MLRKGAVQKSVQKILGHSDPNFTMKAYCDFNSDMCNDAANQMQDIMDSTLGDGEAVNNGANIE